MPGTAAQGAGAGLAVVRGGPVGVLVVPAIEDGRAEEGGGADRWAGGLGPGGVRELRVGAGVEEQGYGLATDAVLYTAAVAATRLYQPGSGTM